MEVKVMIGNIENLKTSTSIKEEKDTAGEVVDRKLMTKIQFEAEANPADLANIHRLLASGTVVHAIIGSPQAVMEAKELEAAFAQK